MQTAAPLDTLRQQVARLTGFTRRAEAKPLAFGITEIDSVTPWSGLARSGIHELIGDQAAIPGLLAALLGRQKGLEHVIWVSPEANLFAPGLAQLGLDHHKLMIAWARRADDRLWATEEALKDLPRGAVIAEVESPGLTETRRLQLAAEASGSIGFLVRRDRQPSAALTRWLVEPARSRQCSPAWKLTLERCRGAETACMSWFLEFDYAAVSLRLAAPMAHRQAEVKAA